jgi:hypothetical protein
LQPCQTTIDKYNLYRHIDRKDEKTDNVEYHNP